MYGGFGFNFGKGIVMKVEIISTEEVINDFTNFTGLAKDHDGDVWLFAEEKCLWLSDESDFVCCDKEGIVKNHGPFTVFTGLLTISN